MEKRKLTYDLKAVKAVLGNVSKLSMTTSALRDAVALGFDRRGVATIIRSMDRRMFYKSMTSYADHKVWQDVYHVPSGDVVLYVKFQASILTEFTVLSFKEK